MHGYVPSRPCPYTSDEVDRWDKIRDASDVMGSFFDILLGSRVAFRVESGGPHACTKLCLDFSQKKKITHSHVIRYSILILAFSKFPVVPYTKPMPLPLPPPPLLQQLCLIMMMILMMKTIIIIIANSNGVMA